VRFSVTCPEHTPCYHAPAVNAGSRPSSENGATDSPGSRVSSASIKTLVLIFLLAAQLFVTFFVTVPGYLSIDEAIYHWTVRDFASTGGFEIWNGYGEFPSVELAHTFLRVHAGRPVSQYPYLFPLLSLPFYYMAGYFGLFVLNSFSFVGLILLCIATTKRLFGDYDLALNSALILVLGTFAWEYSQAAWPHSTSLFISMAAFYLFVRAYRSEKSRTVLGFALLAGIVAGFAPGIRLDAVLVLPCLILPFLFSRPWRPVEAATLLVGAVPGLAVLTATNYIKFDVMTPFSYGTSHAGYGQSIPGAPVVIVALALALAWVATRSAVVSFLRSRLGRKGSVMAVIVFGAVVPIAVLMNPAVRAKSVETARTAYTSLVDIRSVDSDLRLPAMHRSQGGGVIYGGSHKKALLQSLPYLVILILPILSLARTKRDLPQLIVLSLVPVLTIGFYSFFVYGYGGLCLNYRFFLPALPFIAILTAYSLRELTLEDGAPFGYVVGLLIAGTTILTFLFLSRKVFVTVHDLEFPLLVVPLFIAGILLPTLVVHWGLRLMGVRVLRTAVWVLVVISIAWAGSVAFYYDYPQHQRIRARNFLMGEKVLKAIPSDSLFFTAPYIDPFMRLIEGDRIRIGLPVQDRFKDFFPLVDFHLVAGRRVFAVFRADLWERIGQQGPSPYRIRLSPKPLLPGTFLGEISPP
jgi:Dolichyl-phosphate-mannose-protein mannosyltransferase